MPRNRDDKFKKKNLKKKDMKKDFFRKRMCKFCSEKVDSVDYKDVIKLRKFISERGKILPNRISGNCAKHQRNVAAAIKRARQIALLPFVAE